MSEERDYFEVARYSKRLVEQLRSENAKLKEVLSDCVTSLHSEMLGKYGGQNPEDMHPVTRREYEREVLEMSLVHELHKKIGEHKQTKIHAPHTLIISEHVWYSLREGFTGIKMYHSDDLSEDFTLLGLRVVVDENSSWRMEVV